MLRPQRTSLRKTQQRMMSGGETGLEVVGDALWQTCLRWRSCTWTISTVSSIPVFAVASIPVWSVLLKCWNVTMSFHRELQLPPAASLTLAAGIGSTFHLSNAGSADPPWTPRLGWSQACSQEPLLGLRLILDCPPLITVLLFSCSSQLSLFILELHSHLLLFPLQLHVLSD